MNGLSGKSSPKFILGYTSDETVMLDLDKTKLKDVKYWARRAMRWHKLGGFLVLESSVNSYHVVFDRPVTWSENVRVVAWVALYVRRRSLDNWFKMQCIKQKPTLRASNKKMIGGVVKMPPRVVYSEGSQDREIGDYLLLRKLILSVSVDLNM